MTHIDELPFLRGNLDTPHQDCYGNRICDPDRAVLVGSVIPGDLLDDDDLRFGLRLQRTVEAIRYIFDRYIGKSLMAADVSRGTARTENWVQPIIGRMLDDGWLKRHDSECPFNVYKHTDRRSGLVTPMPRSLYSLDVHIPSFSRAVEPEVVPIVQSSSVFSPAHLEV